MPFPPKTLEWAHEVKRKLSSLHLQSARKTLESVLTATSGEEFLRRVAEISNLDTKTAGSDKTIKKRIAEEIYYGLWHGYGFKESLETGNWAPWPHELTRVNCYSQAVATYIVSKLCDLKPLLVEFVGFRKEGSLQRSGHSLVLVDVGEEERPWVIDQAMSMYGPATIEENSMIVENLEEKPERTYRRDYNIRKFGFLKNSASDEESIIQTMRLLQSNPELVLYNGQRIDVPFADTWQTEEPLRAPWYIKFIPDRTGENRGKIFSRLVLDRPKIKSRGLEYCILLGNEGEVVQESIAGYYCRGMKWAEFTEPLLMVDLPFHEILPLLKGLKEIPLQERAKFEIALMNQSSSPSKEYEAHIKAVRKSLERLEGSEYSEVVSAISLVEALYQHAKNGKEFYLSAREREQAIAQLKDTDPLFAVYAKATKIFGQVSREREKLGIKDGKRPDVITQHRLSFLLHPCREVDLSLLRFLALETDYERLEDILKHKPTYLTDAVDRLIFYSRMIEGKEDQVDNLARSEFGEHYGNALFRGYTRIFAEFLGHFAVTQPYVFLEKYKDKIIEKLRSKN